MRRRQGAGSSSSGLRDDRSSGEETTFARTMQRLDLYARVDEDLQVKTESGAAVTIGFWVLMVILVIGEVQAYLRAQPATERVVVDSTMGQRLRINADIVSSAATAPPVEPTLGSVDGCSIP